MKTYQLIIDGTICAWGYSKQWVRNELAKYTGKHVDVRISSYGGDLAHGLDIRQQFKDHGDVTAYLTGFVASSATIIAMGAQRICMSKYAFFLVHKCSNFIDAWGNYNADQMQQLIDDLTKNKKENDRIDVVIAQLYSEKTGKSINELLSLLKEERWLTAEEALEWGFIDEIVEDAGDSKQNLSDEVREKFNAFGLPFNGLEGKSEPESDTPSMLRQILDGIKSLVHGKGNAAEVEPAEDPEPSTDAAPQNKSINNTVMNTISTYAAIATALAVASLEADAEGKVTLTAAQMQALNDRLVSLQNDVTDRDTKINALNTQVENLKKLPGADTKENLDDTSGKAELSEQEMYNLAKSFLD